MIITRERGRSDDPYSRIEKLDNALKIIFISLIISLLLPTANRLLNNVNYVHQKSDLGSTSLIVLGLNDISRILASYFYVILLMNIIYSSYLIFVEGELKNILFKFLGYQFIFSTIFISFIYITIPLARNIGIIYELHLSSSSSDSYSTIHQLPAIFENAMLIAAILVVMFIYLEINDKKILKVFLDVIYSSSVEGRVISARWALQMVAGFTFLLQISYALIPLTLMSFWSDFTKIKATNSIFGIIANHWMIIVRNTLGASFLAWFPTIYLVVYSYKVLSQRYLGRTLKKYLLILGIIFLNPHILLYILLLPFLYLPGYWVVNQGTNVTIEVIREALLKTANFLVYFLIVYAIFVFSYHEVMSSWIGELSV